MSQGHGLVWDTLRLGRVEGGVRDGGAGRGGRATELVAGRRRCLRWWCLLQGRAGPDAVDVGVLGGRTYQRGSYDCRRPHQCTVCGKRFINTSHLRDHIRLHTGERPFSCRICGRSFVQRQHLRQHERVAKCTAPVCLTCNQSFTNREELTMHMRLHLLPPSPSTLPLNTPTTFPHPQ